MKDIFQSAINEAYKKGFNDAAEAFQVEIKNLRLTLIQHHIEIPPAVSKKSVPEKKNNKLN